MDPLKLIPNDHTPRPELTSLIERMKAMNKISMELRDEILLEVTFNDKVVGSLVIQLADIAFSLLEPGRADVFLYVINPRPLNQTGATVTTIVTE